MDNKKSPIVSKLEALKAYYGTLESMVSELQKYPGFEKLNRATVSRWLKEPTGRAELAVKILSKNTGGSQVRIAVPDNLWGQALAYCIINPLSQAPNLPQRTQIVSPQIIYCDNDSETIEHLELGSVDLCFCPRPRTLSTFIKPFCQVARIPLMGLLTQAYTSSSKLSEFKCAISYGNVLYSDLEQFFFRQGLLSPSITILPPNSTFEQFKRNKIQAFISYEPELTHLEDKLHSINKSILREAELFGSTDIFFLVNTEHKDLTHLFPVMKFIYSRLNHLESYKNDLNLLNYLSQKTSMAEKNIESYLERSFFGIHSLQTETFFENILSHNDLWEKRDQRSQKSEVFKPTNIDEFYKYYSQQIANSQEEVWITSDGFNMKNPISKKYSEIMGKAFKKALKNGVHVYRYQILETMHINWIDTLIQVKKQFPKTFHVYINESLKQIPNICIVDPDCDECVYERMEHITGLLGQGSQAQSFVFRHGDKVSAQKHKNMVQNIIDHPNTQHMSVFELQALKQTLLAKRVAQLHKWRALNSQDNTVSLQAYGIFDEQVLAQFLGKQKE